MADHDVVGTISSRLLRVRKTDQIVFPCVRSINPTVGLDTDGDVDLCHRESTGNIADRVVIGVLALAGNGSILRSHCCGASIDAAILGGVVCVDIAERNGRQCIGAHQSVNGNLAIDVGRQLQLGAVILLAVTVGSDCNFLLVEERVDQGAVFSKFLSNLDRVWSLGSAVVRTLNGLIELPASNRRTCQREGLTNLQDLSVGGYTRNRIAIHVDEVDRHLHVLVAGVVEREDVLLFVSSQDERLLDLIGIELDALELGLRGVKRIVVNRSSEFDDRGSVAGHALDLLGRNRGASASFAISDDVVHGIGGRLRLREVHEGDLVVLSRKLDGLAVLVRAIPGHSDGGFGDALANSEVRIADFLVGSNRNTIFVHIMDGIAQRRARPVRIDRGIGLDLSVPLEEVVTVGGGVPAIEDVASLGRIGARCRSGLILLNRLAINARSAVGVKAHRVAWRAPLGVELQVAGWHLVEGVRVALALLVIKPANERIVRVDVTLCSGGGPVIRVACDVGVELHVVDRPEVRAAVIVIDLERVALVVEVVRRNVAPVVGVIVCVVVRVA